MKQIRKRLTYANVMSTIAVFLVLGGATALAAGQLAKNSVGTKQLKNNAVTAAKIKKEAVAAAKIKAGAVGTAQLGAGAVTGDKLAGGAVSGDKLANGAVTGDKLGDAAVSTAKIANGAVSTDKLGENAVTNGKLANGAVTASKLVESEQSQAFRSGISSGTKGLANGLLGTYGPEQAVTSLTLPAGNFVVTGQSEFINTDVSETHDAVCRLIDGSTELAEQSVTALPGLLFPSGGVSAVGVSDGGEVFLACRQGATDKISAYKAQIIAVRVGSVTG